MMSKQPPTNSHSEHDSRAFSNASAEETTTFSIRDMVDVSNHLTFPAMTFTCESTTNDFGLIERRIWVKYLTPTGARRTFLLCRHGCDIRVILWEPSRFFTSKPMQVLDFETPASVFQAICEWTTD